MKWRLGWQSALSPGHQSDFIPSLDKALINIFLLICFNLKKQLRYSLWGKQGPFCERLGPLRCIMRRCLIDAGTKMIGGNPVFQKDGFSRLMLGSSLAFPSVRGRPKRRGEKRRFPCRKIRRASNESKSGGSFQSQATHLSQRLLLFAPGKSQFHFSLPTTFSRLRGKEAPGRRFNLTHPLRCRLAIVCAFLSLDKLGSGRGTPELSPASGQTETRLQISRPPTNYEGNDPNHSRTRLTRSFRHVGSPSSAGRSPMDIGASARTRITCWFLLPVPWAALSLQSWLLGSLQVIDTRTGREHKVYSCGCNSSDAPSQSSGQVKASQRSGNPHPHSKG